MKYVAAAAAAAMEGQNEGSNAATFHFISRETRDSSACNVPARVKVHRITRNLVI